MALILLRKRPTSFYPFVTTGPDPVVHAEESHEKWCGEEI